MFVVDASVFSSVIVKDEFYERAKRFLLEHSAFDLVTVDLAFIEAANVLWKHAFIHRRISRDVYGVLAKSLESLIRTSCSKIYCACEVLGEAMEKALDLGITVYDAIYVALALKHKCKIASFDERLKSKLEERRLDIIHLI